MFWVVDNFLMKKHRTKAKQEEREEDSRGNSKVRYRRAMSHDDSESEVSECHCVTAGVKDCDKVSEIVFFFSVL